MVALSPLLEKTEKLSDGTQRTYSIYLFDEYAALLKKLEPLKPELVALMNEEERSIREKWVNNKKKALFGPDIRMTSPDRYQEVGMVRELGLLAVWHTISIDRRADIIAEYRLKQMADFVIRWYEDEQREKDAKKAKKGSTDGAAQ